MNELEKHLFAEWFLQHKSLFKNFKYTYAQIAYKAFFAGYRAALKNLRESEIESKKHDHSAATFTNSA